MHSQFSRNLSTMMLLMGGLLVVGVARAADEAAASAKPKLNLAPLPFAVTSFGAARIDNCLYVYGGHTGDAHSYNNESQSNKLVKLDLSVPDAKWQEIASGQRLQGLGMVAHGKRLIFLGGFMAMNKKGEKQDLHSQATVRVFDTATSQWSDLPSLPEPRSSHDAAIIGDKVYVVGGWNMSGGNETVWHSTAWVMDLAAASPQWSEIAKPASPRRAIAAVAHREQLFVIGGMDEKGSPTRSVRIYTPSTNSWSDAPDLLGEKSMAGFGASGWSTGKELIVTTYEGDIQRWDESMKAWVSRGKTEDARFFHRLMPISDSELVAIGGANMNSGKYLELEIVRWAKK